MNYKNFLVLLLTFCGRFTFGQDTNVVYEEPVYEEETKVENTFSSTRIINGHSV